MPSIHVTHLFPTLSIAHRGLTVCSWYRHAGQQVPDDAHLRGRDTTFIDEGDDDEFQDISDDDDEDHGHDQGQDDKGGLGVGSLHANKGVEAARNSAVALSAAAAGPQDGFVRTQRSSDGISGGLGTRPDKTDAAAATEADEAVQQRLLVGAFQTMTLREKCALSLADPAKEKFLFGSGAVGDGSMAGDTPSSVGTAMDNMSAADRADVYADVEMIQKNIRR